MTNHDISSDFVYSVRNTVKNCVVTSAEICVIVTSVIIVGISIHTYTSTQGGGWSDWAPWSECDRGLRSRSRNCNNPAPSILGQYCGGRAEEYELCNLAPYKDLLDSDNLNSDTSRQAAETAGGFLSSLSQRTDLIEKCQEKLDNSIKEYATMHELLKKQLQTEREDRIQQNLEFQDEIRIVKDAFNALKSDINKAVEEQISAMVTDNAASQEDVVSTVQDIADKTEVTISDVKNIEDTLSAFKTSHNKIIEEQNAMVRSIRDEFKQQIQTVVERVDEQTAAVKESQQIKHAFDEFKEKTNKKVKDQVTSLKEDYGQLKMTMEQQNTTVKTFRDEHKQQIKAVLDKVEKQTVASQETQQQQYVFDEFKNETNKIVKEQLERELDALKRDKRDLRVAFTAYAFQSSAVIHTVIKFRETHYNGGGAYDTSTGRFTCKIPGIYHFTVTLTKKDKNIDYISAYIRINSLNTLNLHSDPSDNADYGSFAVSAAGTFHLKADDYVDIYGIPGHLYSGRMSYFTGFLVIPDA